jgi:hypothetical protein
MRSSAIMQMLQDKIPLTLLIDLADAEPVKSTQILRHEVADLSWLNEPPPATTPRRGGRAR